MRAPTSRFLATRLAKAVFILLLASGAIFAFGELLPGDECSARMARIHGDYEECAKAWGLDRPAAERYFRWLGGVALGDLGTSGNQLRSVWEIVDFRIWHSTVLLAFAFLWAVPAGIAVGVWTRNRPKSISNRLAGAAQLLGRSLPEFVTGVLLILLLALKLESLPSASVFDPGKGPLTQPEVLVLPGLTIGLRVFAHTFRAVRDGMMEDGGVLPAAIDAMPGIAWWVLGSLFIAEWIFGYPGVGASLLAAINTYDAPLLQAVVFFFVLAYVLVHLAADLLAAALQRRLPEDNQPSSRLTPLPAP